MKVFIIGTGMNGTDTLTKEATDIIASSDILIGAERILRPFSSYGNEHFVSYMPQDIAGKINECGYSSAAVLMSGDCGFYSGTKKLLPLLEKHDVKVIPGISSAVCFCSRLGLSYERMKFISLHGRSSNIAVNVRLNELCFFLLGGSMTAGEVCRHLCEYGLGGVKVYIGTDLGYENEYIISGKACELADTENGNLAVMITENIEHLRHIPSAINDSFFKRSDIPMTKSEVRCIIVSGMDICSDSVIWDIGCGTGSVSVESAFRCPDGKVYAFDKKNEAVSLTAENARLAGCDNIEAITGECPDCLEDIPSPDKVFIGGSSGNIMGIFNAVHAKNPDASIAVSAVTLETLSEALRCFEKYGISPEITNIAVTRSKKAGRYNMFSALNPVYILKGKLS